jgi:hypothetical protein
MTRKYSAPKPVASSHTEDQKIGSSKEKGKKHKKKYVGIDVYEDSLAVDDEISKIQDIESFEVQDVDIDPEDDEEIGEDSAFDESDEEKWGSRFKTSRNLGTVEVVF